MSGDAAQHIGKPGLGIDVVHFGCHNQTIHECRPLTATIRTGEQPRFTAKGDAAQRPFGRIVRQAYPAVVQEPGEGFPALEHIIHGLGHIVVA